MSIAIIDLAGAVGVESGRCSVLARGPAEIDQARDRAERRLSEAYRDIERRHLCCSNYSASALTVPVRRGLPAPSSHSRDSAWRILDRLPAAVHKTTEKHGCLDDLECIKRQDD